MSTRRFIDSQLQVSLVKAVKALHQHRPKRQHHRLDPSVAGPPAPARGAWVMLGGAGKRGRDGARQGGAGRDGAACASAPVANANQQGSMTHRLEPVKLYGELPDLQL